MMKICNILSVLLCCMVLTCGGKTNVKNTTQFDYTAFMEERLKQSKEIEAYMFEEKRLNELRAKVKILFPDIVEYNQISSKYFEGDSISVLKFSGIIYESEGKIVRVPIFKGTMGDVLYEDLLKYCITKGSLEIIMDYDFQVSFKRGEFNKVLGEFKKFYGRYLSIDFSSKPTEQPERIFIRSYDSLYTYDFVLDGVAGKLSFCVPWGEYIPGTTELIYYITIE